MVFKQPCGAPSAGPHLRRIVHRPRGDSLISNNEEIWEQRAESAIAVISDEGHKTKGYEWLTRLVFVGWLLFIATSFWQKDSIWDGLGRLFQSRLAAAPVGVLLPNDKNLAVKGNANRQLLGFRYAFDKHDVVQFMDWGQLERLKITDEELQALLALTAISEEDNWFVAKLNDLLGLDVARKKRQSPAAKLKKLFIKNVGNETDLKNLLEKDEERLQQLLEVTGEQIGAEITESRVRRYTLSHLIAEIQRKLEDMAAGESEKLKVLMAADPGDETTTAFTQLIAEELRSLVELTVDDLSKKKEKEQLESKLSKLIGGITDQLIKLTVYDDPLTENKDKQLADAPLAEERIEGEQTQAGPFAENLIEREQTQAGPFAEERIEGEQTQADPNAWEKIKSELDAGIPVVLRTLIALAAIKEDSSGNSDALDSQQLEATDDAIRKFHLLIGSEAQTLAGILENKRDLDQHIHRFPYPLKRPAGEDPCGKSKKIQNSDYCDIFDVLEKWYEAGKRTFIVTMSGAALGIKRDFKRWARTKPKTDQPVLVATVASAPGIAELDEGIFRHYIRSQDESDVFATFIESLPPLSGLGDRPVFVLYVDDKYGDAANKDIEERFSETAGIKTIPVPIPVSPLPSYAKIADHCAKGPTVGCIKLKTDQNVFARLELNGGWESKNAVVIIVGYGAIIKRLLLALHDREPWESPRFKGKILVVSTFTEEDWRPSQYELNPISPQLYTVAPKSPQQNRYPYTRGVVFQWSYLTLDRALREECKDARQPEEFWRCWADAEKGGDHLGMKTTEVHDADWADVEFTADGDSRVKLRLLKCEQWNTALKWGESC